MTALYQEISDSILEQVQSGILRIGEKLPPEADYAATLGISRSTLRLAFAELERVGVLERKKRAGTTIISSQPKRRFSMSTTGIYDLLSLGRDTVLSDILTRKVDAKDNPALNIDDGKSGQWLEVIGTRTLPNETTPFNVSRVYVPKRFAGIEPLLIRDVPSVFRVIEDNYDVAVGRVSQTVKAIACPEAEATTMGLSVGAPVLRIDAQLYLRNGELMEMSVAFFDPDRFQVRTDVEID